MVCWSINIAYTYTNTSVINTTVITIIIIIIIVTTNNVMAIETAPLAEWLECPTWIRYQ